MTYAMNQIKYRAKNLLFPVKKKLIKKFGRNLIPLYFWLVSLTFYRTFYIFNVDFFLPGILFLRFVEFLLMGWLIFDPFSKACHTRELIMMKNFLPIMFILTCIFSQHYFYISLLIFATILLISIISYILLYRESKRNSQYNKRRIRIKPVFQRIFIVTSVVLLLVPSVWGIFLLNKPLIKVSKSESLTEYNDTDSVDSFQQYENSLIKLSPEVWKKLNIDDQLTLAQTIVNIESESLGIPPVQVVADAQPRSLYGEYSLTTNKITINFSLLAKNDATEFVRTLCHEVRHSYQHYVVELIDWNDFNTAKLSLFSDAHLWKTDFDSTEITNDYDKYYNRNIEIDAREYSEERLEMYIGFLKGNQLSLEN